jgi:alpha-aminoadipate carrier protein LysW
VPQRRPGPAKEADRALPARAGSRYNPDSVLPGVFHMATCPECDAELDIDEFDVDKGDVISCPECGSNLEVTGLAPLEIEVIEEDDDEDDLEEADEEEGDEDEDEDEEEDRWEE